MPLLRLPKDKKTRLHRQYVWQAIRTGAAVINAVAVLVLLLERR